jgi:coenzyme F420-reducing hydrogenase alpha subunit
VFLVHSTDDIRIDNITKLEGHGSLAIKVKDKKVTYVKLKILESKRFYTQAIRGKSAIALPTMTSRICGTCSIAHLSCCSEAVERAFGYTPSDQTIALRKLSMNGMMIRDHAMHLYLFCLPDIYGKDSVLDFDDSQQGIIRNAFEVKSSGNNLSKVVAGRAIHATFAEVGKFAHVPTKEAVTATVKELKDAREHALEFVDTFYNCDFKLERDTNFVALTNDDYSYIGGHVEDSKGESIEEDSYMDYLKQVIIPYSEASGYEFEGEEFIVGAIARMNLNKNSLHKDTKSDVQKYLKAFPSKNIYHNNLAQAIEVLNCIDSSIETLETTDFKEENAPPVKIKAGRGVALLEAPRGTLYYMLDVDKSGKVEDGRIIVPTQQNQICMEKSVGQVVEQNIEKDKKEIEYEIEKVIRAYDPCMSCASHFLKIKWL